MFLYLAVAALVAALDVLVHAVYLAATDPVVVARKAPRAHYRALQKNLLHVSFLNLLRTNTVCEWNVA